MRKTIKKHKAEVRRTIKEHKAKTMFEKDRSEALGRMEAGKKGFVVGGIVDKRKVEEQAHVRAGACPCALEGL